MAMRGASQRRRGPTDGTPPATDEESTSLLSNNNNNSSISSHVRPHDMSLLQTHLRQHRHQPIKLILSFFYLGLFVWFYVQVVFGSTSTMHTHPNMLMMKTGELYAESEHASGWLGWMYSPDGTELRSYYRKQAAKERAAAMAVYMAKAKKYKEDQEKKKKLLIEKERQNKQKEEEEEEAQSATDLKEQNGEKSQQKNSPEILSFPENQNQAKNASVITGLHLVAPTIHKKSPHQNMTLSNADREQLTTSSIKGMMAFIFWLLICVVIRLSVSFFVGGPSSDTNTTTTTTGGGVGLFGSLARRTPAANRATLRRAQFESLVRRLNRTRAANGERPISAESLRVVLSHRDFNPNDYESLLRFDEENGNAAESLMSTLGATQAEIDRCPDYVIEREDDLLLVGKNKTKQQQQRGGSGTLLPSPPSSFSPTYGDAASTTSSTATPLTSNLHSAQSHLPSSSSSSTTAASTAQSCPICLEKYIMGDHVRTIPCFHTFHVQCIDPWLSQKAICPVCKHPAIG